MHRVYNIISDYAIELSKKIKKLLKIVFLTSFNILTTLN